MPLLLQTFKKASAAADHVIKIMQKNIKLVARPAICFDIDETLILNHPDDVEKFQPNPPIIAIYDWAIDNNVAVYIITARPKIEDNARWTEKILEKVGVHEYKRIYYEPLEYDGKCHSLSKYAYRRRIHEKHKDTIMLSVGDQWTDLFKLTKNCKKFTETLDRRSYHVCCGDNYSLIGLKLDDYNQ